MKSNKMITKNLKTIKLGYGLIEDKTVNSIYKLHTMGTLTKIP